MKKLLLVTALMFATVTAQASVVSVGGWEIESSTQYDATGTAWFNLTETGDPANPFITGVASVGQITANSGDVIWDTAIGTMELSIVINGGQVSFYETAVGTFSSTGGFATDSAALSAGTLLFSTTATITDNAGGIGGGFSFNLGVLDVADAGLLGAYFDSNTFDGNDFQFVLSGTKNTTGPYDFIGASTLTGVTVVPVPGAQMLFGAGLMGLVGMRRKA